MADYGNETSRISDLIRQYRDEPLQDIGDVAEQEKSQDQSKRATDLSEYMDKYKTKMEEGGEEIGGGVLLEGGRKIYGRARTLYKKYKEATENNQTKKEFRPREGQRSDPQAENEEPLENPEGFTEDTAPEVGDGSIGKTISEAPKLETIGEEEEGEEETDPFDPAVDDEPNQPNLLSPQEQAKANFDSAKKTSDTDTSGETALGEQESDASGIAGKIGNVGKKISPEPKLETIGEEGTLTPEQQQASANDLFSQIENQSQFSEQRTYETRNIEPTSDDSGGGGGGGGASAETDVSDSTRVFGEGTSSGRVVGKSNW